MIVLGLDPGFASSPTGAALLDTDPLRLIEAREFRPHRGGDWQRRCDDVLRQIYAVVSGYGGGVLIAYALPHLRQNPQTALRLADLAGGFRGLAVAHDLACIGVQEAESKIALANDANATKQAMIVAAQRVFGRALSEHCADAAGHALAGEATWRRGRLVGKAQC